MREVFRTIEKVARSNATVLVLGETGVGKELVAEALHRNSSRSSDYFRLPPNRVVEFGRRP